MKSLTARELIEELQKLPPDSFVGITHWDGDIYVEGGFPVRVEGLEIITESDND